MQASLLCQRLAQRPVTRGVAAQLRLMSHSSPKWQWGSQAIKSENDDRTICSVVNGKTFLLRVFNGPSVMDSIYNRVASAGVAFAFGGGIILYWPVSMASSFLTLLMWLFLALLIQLHTAKWWTMLPIVAWLLYKFLF
eukprot:EG_transcript_33977